MWAAWWPTSVYVKSCNLAFGFASRPDWVVSFKTCILQQHGASKDKFRAPLYRSCPGCKWLKEIDFWSYFSLNWCGDYVFFTLNSLSCKPSSNTNQAGNILFSPSFVHLLRFVASHSRADVNGYDAVTLLTVREVIYTPLSFGVLMWRMFLHSVFWCEECFFIRCSDVKNASSFSILIWRILLHWYEEYFFIQYSDMKNTSSFSILMWRMLLHSVVHL